MSRYYRVLVECRDIFDVVVKAKNEDEAREIAQSNFGGDIPMESEVGIYDISELEVKRKVV